VYSAIWIKRIDENQHILHVSIFSNRRAVPIWEYDEDEKPIGNPDWLYFPKQLTEEVSTPVDTIVSPPVDFPPDQYDGFILMVDALATRMLSIEGSVNFISNRQEFIKKVWSDKFPLENNMDSAIKVQEPRLFVFNDTVIVTWKLPDGVDYPEYLPIVMEYIIPMISEGFKSHIMWRGAISCGKYIIQGQNTVIGPAVTDAASWHEKAEWVGIVATPYLGKMVSLCALENGGQKRYKQMFCEYGVPLKDNHGGTSKKKMWVVSWPEVYLKEGDARKRFYQDIKNFPVPLGTEEKFYQTRDFLNEFLKRYEE